MELIDHLIQSLSFDENRKKIKSILDLANFILDQCASNMFDARPSIARHMRCTELYGDSINDLVRATLRVIFDVDHMLTFCL